MKIYNLILATLFLLMIASNIYAANIDCGKTKTAIEKTICDDDELLKLDESLDEAYRQALKLKRGIRKSQRQWLKYERNICHSIDCIKIAYETRIQELSLSHYGIVIYRNTPTAEITSKPSKPEITEPNETPIQTQIKTQKPTINSPYNTPIVKFSAPLTPSGKISVFAGKTGLTGSTDGFGTKARFNNPFGVTTDGTNLYVSETTNQTIRKIEIATGKVTTIAGKPGKKGAVDGIGSAARFNFPHGIATDGKNLYVADFGNGTIRKVVIATRKVTTLAGTHGNGGYSDRVGMATQFSSPQEITIVANNLYVTDADTIRKIDVTTGEVTTFAGKRNACGFTDSIASTARFCLPEGITTDGLNLYVADWFNNTVRKIEIATGKVTTLAGPDNATCVRDGRRGKCPGGSGTDRDDGSGTTARFNFPNYITCDGTNLYLTEGDRVIRKIVISTGEVTTLSTTSKEPILVIGGIANDGTSLYFTDVGRHTILRIQ